MTNGTRPGDTHLLLVRHGETVWHADNRYAGGGSDIDLTDLGRQQAADLAAWARSQPLSAVVVSPVRRAIETARPTAAALGLPLEIVDELREVDFGVAEGRTVDELMSLDAAMVQRFRADPAAHPFPGSESAGDAARRAQRALLHIGRTYAGGCVLVVAHNTLLRLGLCSLLGLPVERYRQLFPRLDNAAVTEVLLPGEPTEPAALLNLNAPVTTRPPSTSTTHHQAARPPGRLNPEEHR